MKVILTHEHADFDAVASMVGLARLVPDAIPVLPQAVNENVADFLTLFGGDLPLRRRDELPRSRVTHAWIVDTRRVQSVRGMTPDTPRSIIDHHSEAEPADAAVLELDAQAVGATSTLIAERLASAGAALPEAEATLLLLGIYEDTGAFTFGGTTARDLRAAAWLLAGGADLAMRSRFLRHALSAESQALYRQLLDGAETLEIDGHAVTIATARAEGFAEEIATIATKLLDLLEPSALFVLVDVGDHVQMVGRRTGDGIDVGAVAERLGGGGHARASAAVLRSCDLDAARAAIRAALPAAVQARSRVADIMSVGPVRTFGADTPISLALTVAAQVGHEGFPVLDAERVVGVVTRHDLDRAARHHLAHLPVRALLGGTCPAVAPDDSTDRLLQLMLEHDVGQVPVVADGKLLGIATRTDLLRLWAARARSGTTDRRPINVAAALTRALRPEALCAVRQVADMTRARDEVAYLVGGIPRDCMLGVQPGPDIDVVVVGDAPAVARAAAAAHGGRVTAHSRFGTAKWIRGDVAVDVISARTEFYREPTALPSVARGTLRSDLRRRDFTVNTLAIVLSTDGFGDIVDLFNGLGDLAKREIRVLHSLSFIEDPTRIMRAARFAARFGFRTERRTAELLTDAVALLGRLSGARLRNELLQAMAEPQPAGVLELLDRWGVCQAIHPGLTFTARAARQIECLPAAWAFWRRMAPRIGLPVAPDNHHGLALWLADHGAAGVAAADRLRLCRGDAELVRAVVSLGATPGVLADRDAPGSRLFRALRGASGPVLVLAWLGSRSDTVRRNLMRYATSLAGTTAMVTGTDLAAMGVPPGPAYGRALDAVLDARLDGRIASRDEALALARAVLERGSDGASA